MTEEWLSSGDLLRRTGWSRRDKRRSLLPRPEVRQTRLDNGLLRKIPMWRRQDIEAAEQTSEFANFAALRRAERVQQAPPPIAKDRSPSGLAKEASIHVGPLPWQQLCNRAREAGADLLDYALAGLVMVNGERLDELDLPDDAWLVLWPRVFAAVAKEFPQLWGQCNSRSGGHLKPSREMIMRQPTLPPLPSQGGQADLAIDDLLAMPVQPWDEADFNTPPVDEKVEAASDATCPSKR